MTRDERIKELEKQLPPMTNEPNQDEIDTQQKELLEKGKK